MANTILLRYDSNDFEQIDGVQYAEYAAQDSMPNQDNEVGVKIQFTNGETAFKPGAQIAGMYPEGTFNLPDHQEQLFDPPNHQEQLEF